MFKLEIKTDGAAFRALFTGEKNNVIETAKIRRLLSNVSYELEWLATSGNIFDVNGNKVGSWSR